MNTDMLKEVTADGRSVSFVLAGLNVREYKVSNLESVM